MLAQNSQPTRKIKRYCQNEDNIIIYAQNLMTAVFDDNVFCALQSCCIISYVCIQCCLCLPVLVYIICEHNKTDVV